MALELREATARFDQARESLAAWRERIVLPLDSNVTDANRSFTKGDTRRLTDARVRERELAADEQRARARIERAVGRSCPDDRASSWRRQLG